MTHETQQDFKRLVQNQFGKNAAKYVTSASHAKGDDLDLLVDWLSPGPDWLALDIATGGGHTAAKLSSHVRHVIATDLTRPMLEAAANHLKKLQCGNVMFVTADAEQLPFLDETFDAATCRIAAHHFPNPSLFLQETARVLKRGGSFLFIDNIVPEDEALGRFMNQFEGMRDISHVRCLSADEWTLLAGQAGLRMKREERSRKTHHFPTWVIRTAETEQQADEVERFILNAEPESSDYYSVRSQDGKIQSLQIDEWRVLFEKA
jgi:ubiquinone/menaquinone biosynthesis C-methylase UbiE